MIQKNRAAELRKAQVAVETRFNSRFPQRGPLHNSRSRAARRLSGIGGALGALVDQQAQTAERRLGMTALGREEVEDGRESRAAAAAACDRAPGSGSSRRCTGRSRGRAGSDRAPRCRARVRGDLEMLLAMRLEAERSPPSSASRRGCEPAFRTRYPRGTSWLDAAASAMLAGPSSEPGAGSRQADSARSSPRTGRYEEPMIWIRHQHPASLEAGVS